MMWRHPVLAIVTLAAQLLVVPSQTFAEESVPVAPGADTQYPTVPARVFASSPASMTFDWISLQGEHRPTVAQPIDSAWNGDRQSTSVATGKRCLKRCKKMAIFGAILVGLGAGIAATNDKTITQCRDSSCPVVSNRWIFTAIPITFASVGAFGIVGGLTLGRE
jgi:hypothetical protein